MDRIFLDTSAMVAFFDRKDSNHADAGRLLENCFRERIRLVGTDYVLSECITTILMRTNHATAVKAAELVFASKAIELVWLDKPIKLQAWDYFKRHSDKKYSFTDCTSFVLMKEMKIAKCLSFDDHFKQAGFSPL